MHINGLRVKLQVGAVLVHKADGLFALFIQDCKGVFGDIP